MDTQQRLGASRKEVGLCAGFVYCAQSQLPSIYLAAVELTGSQRFCEQQPGKGHRMVLSSEVRFASSMGMGWRGGGEGGCAIQTEEYYTAIKKEENILWKKTK